jgi:integrase
VRADTYDARLFAGVTDARVRMAIIRACKAAGVPRFTPHDLRHRRVSLLHRQGRTWAENELTTVGDYDEPARRERQHEAATKNRRAVWTDLPDVRGRGPRVEAGSPQSPRRAPDGVPLA